MLSCRITLILQSEVFVTSSTLSPRTTQDGPSLNTSDERAKPTEADLILKSLLTSMRFGHGAAILMRLGTLEESETEVRYFKPDESLEVDVKRHVIFGETSRDNA
jgi:hypothetical protein